MDEAKAKALELAIAYFAAMPENPRLELVKSTDDPGRADARELFKLADVFATYFTPEDG